MPPKKAGASSGDARGLAIASHELPLIIAGLFQLSPEHDFVTAAYSQQELIGKIVEKDGAQLFISCVVYRGTQEDAQQIKTLLAKFQQCKQFFFFFDTLATSANACTQFIDLMTIDRKIDQGKESSLVSIQTLADRSAYARVLGLFNQDDKIVEQNTFSPNRIQDILFFLLKRESSSRFFETFLELAKTNLAALEILLTASREYMPTAETMTALQQLAEKFGRRLSIDSLCQLNDEKAYLILLGILLNTGFSHVDPLGSAELKPLERNAIVTLKHPVTGQEIFFQGPTQTQIDKTALPFRPEKNFTDAIQVALATLGVRITDPAQCFAALFNPVETKLNSEFTSRQAGKPPLEGFVLCYSTTQPAEAVQTLTREKLTVLPNLLKALSDQARRYIDTDQLPLTEHSLACISYGLLKELGFKLLTPPSATPASFQRELSRYDVIKYDLWTYTSVDKFMLRFKPVKSVLKAGRHLCFIAGEGANKPTVIFCDKGKLTCYYFEAKEARLPTLENSTIEIIAPINNCLFEGFISSMTKQFSSEKHRLARRAYPHVSLYNQGVGLVQALGSAQKNVLSVRILNEDTATGMLQIAYGHYRQLVESCVKAGMWMVGVIKDPRHHDLAHAFQIPGSDEVLMLLHPFQLKDRIGIDPNSLAKEINDKIKGISAATKANTKLIALVVDTKNSLQAAIIPPGDNKWGLIDLKGQDFMPTLLNYIGISQEEGKPLLIETPKRPQIKKGELKFPIVLNEVDAKAKPFSLVTPMAHLKKSTFPAFFKVSKDNPEMQQQAPTGNPTIFN